jgi:hypothetical protein
MANTHVGSGTETRSSGDGAVKGGAPPKERVLDEDAAAEKKKPGFVASMWTRSGLSVGLLVGMFK